jgi:hypothetical protein
LIDIKNPSMKGYFFLICVWCIVALSKGDWVRVWEDNFDWNGGVDLNKWSFEEGGKGWGLLFILIYFLF